MHCVTIIYRFQYKKGLSCAWHEAMTDTDTCTSATASRLVYTMLDLCCQHYGVRLEAGKHVPKDMDVRPVEVWDVDEWDEYEWDEDEWDKDEWDVEEWDK